MRLEPWLVLRLVWSSLNLHSEDSLTLYGDDFKIGPRFYVEQTCSYRIESIYRLLVFARAWPNRGILRN